MTDSLILPYGVRGRLRLLGAGLCPGGAQRYSLLGLSSEGRGVISLRLA